MVRKHVVPESNSLMVAIPDSYIGKKVEVLVFADEDMVDPRPAKGNMSKYKGVLSPERALEFHKYADQARQEWDRNI